VAVNSSKLANAAQTMRIWTMVSLYGTTTCYTVLGLCFNQQRLQLVIR
jgi:hypothetical protein